MNSKQKIQLEAVKAILNGELFIEEAMVKYNVKDKRTISAWIKKTLPLLEMAKALPAHKEPTAPLKQQPNREAPYFDVLRENALLKKVIELQDKVLELESKNHLLSKHHDFLMKERYTSEKQSSPHETEDTLK